MAQNITIAGAEFSAVPAIVVPKTGGGNAEFVDKESTLLKMGALRPDAEMVKSWSYDKSLVDDWELSVPAYSTTAVTVKAGEAESQTYTLDYANYNYYVIQRMLSIPEYSIATKGKGRVEYWIASYIYEIAEIPANSLRTLVDSSKILTSRSVSVAAAGVFYRSLYWSSGTAIAAYSSAAYTVAQAVVAPTVSSGVLTVSTPNCTMRGSSTYFSQTYWDAITDIRYQWIAELYRAPKNHLNLDGWGTATQMLRVIDCVNNPTHKLV